MRAANFGEHVIRGGACARELDLHVKRKPVVGARKLERDRMQPRWTDLSVLVISN